MICRVISSSPRVNSSSVYLFAARDALDQIEIRRGEQPEVLAILLVDALYVFGDYEPYARGDLGVRRLLAARPFAAPLA